METGKVEFAPDYKSNRKSKYPEMTERFKQLDQRHERLRLEREVVEAAKADLMAETRKDGDHGFDGIDRLIAARRRYRAAVLALLEFETNQQQKGK